MAGVTIQDLIATLRKASANPESHAPAQMQYFSELKPNSVLTHCGTACCIAGDLILRASLNEQASQAEIDRIILTPYESDPYSWAQDALGLSNVEASLAFESNTHHEIHSLLADLLEAGLRLPDRDAVSMHSASTYTVFHEAYLEEEDRYMDLEELKEWMRFIAQ
jgi:hypothetical protein